MKRIFFSRAFLFLILIPFFVGCMSQTKVQIRLDGKLEPNSMGINQLSLNEKSLVIRWHYSKEVKITLASHGKREAYVRSEPIGVFLPSDSKRLGENVEAFKLLISVENSSLIRYRIIQIKESDGSSFALYDGIRDFQEVVLYFPVEEGKIIGNGNSLVKVEILLDEEVIDSVFVGDLGKLDLERIFSNKKNRKFP